MLFRPFFPPHPQTPLQSLIPCGFPGVDYKRPDFINGIKTRDGLPLWARKVYKRPDFINGIKT